MRYIIPLLLLTIPLLSFEEKHTGITTVCMDRCSKIIRYDKESLDQMILESIRSENLKAFKLIKTRSGISPYYRIKGKTVLEHAMWYPDFIKLMITQNTPLNRAINGYTESLLDRLRRIRDLEFHPGPFESYEYLQKLGAKPVEKLSRELYKALLKNNQEKIAWLKDEGTTLTDALQYAIEAEDYKGAKKIADLGGDLSKAIPFIWNLKAQNRADILKLITCENINLVTQYGTLLTMAIFIKDQKLVQDLITKGADINRKPPFEPPYNPYINQQIYFDEATPIRVAIITRQLKIMERLLKQDVIVTPEDISYLLAAPEKRLEMIKLLIQYHVNFRYTALPQPAYDYVTHRNFDVKTTPLIMAIRLKQVEIAKLLIKGSYLNYIEVDHRYNQNTRKNHTALDYAIELKLNQLVEILKKSGAKKAAQLEKRKMPKNLNPEIKIY